MPPPHNTSLTFYKSTHHPVLYGLPQTGVNWRSLCSKRNTQARDLSPIRVPSATHRCTPYLSHSWKPTGSPKPCKRTQFIFYSYIYNYYDALCIWFAIMRFVQGPCIAALHVWVAQVVPICFPALCCWCWIIWCMHVLCIDSDVHSCFELWSALSHSSWIRCYVSVTYYYYYYY